MSRARLLGDSAGRTIVSDITAVANSVKVENLIYGPDAVPVSLDENAVYIQVV